MHVNINNILKNLMLDSLLKKLQMLGARQVPAEAYDMCTPHKDTRSSNDADAAFSADC